MIHLVHLTKEEIDLLTQHKKKALCELIRLRSHAILLFEKGYRIATIADVLFKSEKTVREWMKAFERERIASLFPKYLHNQHAAKLTAAQKQEIKHVLKKKPSAYGIPKEFWDISALKHYITAEFGVAYESDESYRLLFLLHHYSFHLPDTFDVHRDEGKVAKRIKEIKQEIQPYLLNTNWIVFASDESRILWETTIRRLWLPKGKKSIIRVERKRKSQSFIGFLHLQTGEELLFPLSWQKQDTIIPVLEELV